MSKVADSARDANTEAERLQFLRRLEVEQTRPVPEWPAHPRNRRPKAYEQRCGDRRELTPKSVWQCKWVAGHDGDHSFDRIGWIVP